MNQHEDIKQALQQIEQSDVFLSSRWFAKEYFKDANKNDIPDSAERRIRLEEKILEEYAEVLNPSKSFLDRLRAFLGASSKAGRKAKAIKDFVLLFTPYGEDIASVSEFVSKRFINPKQQTDKPMKDIIGRVFTKSNGGFIRLWDELEGRDWKYYVAFILRIGIIIGAFYVADYLGLPVDKLLTAILGA